MAYELRDGQGSMFELDAKTEKHPSFEGTLMVKGERVRFKAWRKVARSGQVYYSLSEVQPWDEQRCEIRVVDEYSQQHPDDETPF